MSLGRNNAIDSQQEVVGMLEMFLDNLYLALREVRNQTMSQTEKN